MDTESFSWVSLSDEERTILCERSGIDREIAQELVDLSHHAFSIHFDDGLHYFLKSEEIQDALKMLYRGLSSIQRMSDGRLNALLPHLSEILPSELNAAKSKLVYVRLSLTLISADKRSRGKPRTDELAQTAQALLEAWEEFTGRPVGRTTSPRSASQFYAYVLPRLKIPKGVNARGENTFYNMRKHADSCVGAFRLARRRMGRKLP